MQDFLNTSTPHRRIASDLLTDVAEANDWFEVAYPRWGFERAVAANFSGSFASGDLDVLREFRTSILTAILAREGRSEGGAAAIVEPQRMTMTMGADGVVRLTSEGRPVDIVRGLVLSEVYAAQLTDTWRRLKSCKNPRCRGVFFDFSKNNSRVWHDVRTCGNQANQRIFKQRHGTGGGSPLRTPGTKAVRGSEIPVK